MPRRKRRILGVKRRRSLRQELAKATARERGRGLRPDDAFLKALRADPATCEWLRRNQPEQFVLIEKRLREIEYDEKRLRGMERA
jgi:hypothetical protein